MVINLDPVAHTRLNSRRDLGTFASDRKIDGQAFGSGSSGLMSKQCFGRCDDFDLVIKAKRLFNQVCCQL